MDRQTALCLQLRIQVYALAGVLRRPDPDARTLWSLADLVLDSLDAAGVEDGGLRAEVRALMRRVAARAPVDGPGAAARLTALADACAAPPVHPGLALAG